MPTRRDLLRLAPAAVLPSCPGAGSAPPLGKLKITRFVLHKATLRWRDLMFLEIHTDGGLVGVGEASLFKRLLDAKAAAVVQPDVLHCGGITELRRIANLAETYGAEIAPHQCYGPLAHAASLAAVAGCRNFLIHEWEAQDDPLFSEATGGTYPVQQGGYIALPERPGLGIEMDLAAFCKRFPYSNGPKSMRDLTRSSPGAAR